MEAARTDDTTPDTRANFPREIDRAVAQWNNERSKQRPISRHSYTPTYTPSPIGQYNATTFEGAGHWTQVVWKHSRNLGCAAYSCPQGTLGKKEGDKWKCACRLCLGLWVVEMQRPCDDANAPQPSGTTSATTTRR